MTEGVPEIGLDSPVADSVTLGDQLASIHSGLTKLQGTLNELKTCFGERIQHDAAKDRAFDVLHSKLREQDTDQSAALKKNLVLALLRLHDHMHEAEAALEEGSPGRQRVADLRLALLDILYSEDIEPIATAGGETITTVGGKFDRTRQKAVGSVPTTDPAQDDTVQRVVREGFVYAGRVLRPQTVIVWRYQGSTDQQLVKGP